MLFFRTNMDKTEQWDCSYYLQFAHSVETLTRKISGQREGSKKKTTTKKLATETSRRHPEADWSGVRQTLTGLHWKKGIRASAWVWAEGFQQRCNGEGEGGGKSHDGRRFPLIVRHQGRWTPPTHTHQDRQHHRFQFITTLLCVSVILFFFFSSSFIRKCFNIQGVRGDHSLLVSSVRLQIF